MSSLHYDIIIVGLGAMGAAGLYQLSRSGARVLGLDRFDPPHQRGSSHGLTRVIREAYFEDPLYVPLLQRAYQLWQELEQHSPEPLLQLTGGLMIGEASSELVTGCLASARQFQLAHEALSAEALMQRHPLWQLPTNFKAVVEPRTGFLYPERIISLYLQLARAQGAEVRSHCPVLDWQVLPEGFAVRTDNAIFTCKQLILASGAWMPELAPVLKPHLQVTRQSLFWLQPDPAEAFALGQFPVFLLEVSPGVYLYGFPDEGEGFKVALHAPGPRLEPDSLPEQQDSPQDLQAIRYWLQRYLPAANGDVLKEAVCMYTNAPDHHFIFDRHPRYENLLLVSPCSGHGFKFSSVFGDLMAKWALGQALPELPLFGLARLSENADSRMG